jgi:beta-glucanase (GH16 family)
MVINPWVDVKFYVNGTLVATHTTYVPSIAWDIFITLWTSIAAAGIEVRPILVSIEN